MSIAYDRVLKKSDGNDIDAMHEYVDNDFIF